MFDVLTIPRVDILISISLYKYVTRLLQYNNVIINANIYDSI